MPFKDALKDEILTHFTGYWIGHAQLLLAQRRSQSQNHWVQNSFRDFQTVMKRRGIKYDRHLAENQAKKRRNRRKNGEENQLINHFVKLVEQTWSTMQNQLQVK